MSSSSSSSSSSSPFAHVVPGLDLGAAPPDHDADRPATARPPSSAFGYVVPGLDDDYPATPASAGEQFAYTNDGGSSVDEDEMDEFEIEEDELEASAFDDLRAEDEDWEIAERGAHSP